VGRGSLDWEGGWERGIGGEFSGDNGNGEIGCWASSRERTTGVMIGCVMAKRERASASVFSSEGILEEQGRCHG